VIVRMSSNIVSESQLGPYLTYLESHMISKYEAAPGMVRVHLLQRRFVGYVETLTVSLWRSQEAVRQFMESELLTEDVKREWCHRSRAAELRSRALPERKTAR
jgi:heme-degrading monooxygenase HmoA